MADTLERAVMSAAGADEIHVVDDASSDNIGEVMARLPFKVTYWRWPVKSRNHLAALRTVYHASACRQIIGMGADDYLKPGLIEAVRENDEAPVILSAYDVVDPDERRMNHVTQDVQTPTLMTADQMRARIESPRIATETGIGSSLRCDVADWLWDRQWEIMGPHMDSLGYAAAAVTFGCLLLPFVGASYTTGRPSYGRDAIKTQEQAAEAAKVCKTWLESAAQLQDSTVRALCKKRCFVTW
jgi:hypothetical protein